MWTHLTPYRPYEPTKEYIFERGSLSLYRALNTKRVVGFIGSGISSAYGRPDWQGLVNEARKHLKERLQYHQYKTLSELSGRKLTAKEQKIVDQYKDIISENERSRFRAAKHSIHMIYSELEVIKDTKGKLPTQLSLIEKLAGLLGENAKLGVRTAISQVSIKKRNSKEEESTILDAYNQSMKTLNDSFFGIRSKKNHFEKSASPLDALISDLQISRYLTLNYDVEIERELSKQFPVEGNNQDETEFQKLINLKGEISSQSATFGSRVGHSEVTRKHIASVSLDGENVGELVNFSMFAKQFDAQVFHLHGRYDNPEHMVLTDDDYRRVYIGNDLEQFTFDEAFSSVFAGNDVIISGIGMTEEDVLRPLRHFMDGSQVGESASRHVYALFPETVSFDLNRAIQEIPNSFNSTKLRNWFNEQFILRKQEKDFDRDELIPVDPDEEPSKKNFGANQDLISDASWAIQLYDQYGVYTLHYGNQIYRSVCLICKFLESIADIELGRLSVDQTYKRAIIQFAKGLKAETEEIRNLIAGEHNASGYKISDRKNLITIEELKCLGESLEAICITIDKRKWTDKHAKTIKNFGVVFHKQILSRATETFYRDIAKSQEKWWTLWRQVPGLRKPRYSKTYASNKSFADIDYRLYPSFIRHRSKYTTESNGVPLPVLQNLETYIELRNQFQIDNIGYSFVYEKSLDNDTIDKKNKLLSQAEYNKLDKTEKAEIDLTHKFRGNRRVVRVALSRGGGKGSLVYLLQQRVKIKNNDYFVYDHLLHDSNENEKSCYFSGFFAHLTFSMEFASVVDALSFFFQDAAIGLILEFINPIKKLKGTKLADLGLDLSKSNFNDVERFFENLLNAIQPIDGERKDRLKEHRNTLEGFYDAQRKEIFSDFQTHRRHRISLLKFHMQIYSILAAILSKEGDSIINDGKPATNFRLFVCLSGIDKLCDSDGIAYNPMYRALFRLLSGNGLKYLHESVPEIPMDLLIVSGKVDEPTRYLSKEHKEKNVNALEPIDLDGIYHHNFKPIKGGETYLEKWVSLPILNYSLNAQTEEYFLTPVNNDTKNHRKLGKQKFADFVAKFCENFKLEYNSNTDHGSEQFQFFNLQQLLSSSVAFRRWTFSLLLEKIFSPPHRKLPSDEEVNARIEQMKHKLGNVLERGGQSELIEFFASEARIKIANCCIEKLDKNLVRKLTKLEKLPEYKSLIQEMFDITLAHLALFPIPVEISVLRGCNEINDLLKRLQNLDESFRVNEQLLMMFEEMVRLGFAVEVYPKMDRTMQDKPLEAISAKEVKTFEGWQKSWYQNHRRFTLHGFMREYFTREMRLAIKDQSEQNFYQISLYCDQPKDLPSPNEKHYELVQSIVENMIRKSRETLWCLYQLKNHANVQQRLSKYDYGLLKRGLFSRLTNGQKNKTNFDDNLLAFHSVSHRTRAVYGLLRGAFSLGALTRLSGTEAGAYTNPPFVKHADWLRGITNISIAIDDLDPLFKFFEREKRDDLQNLLPKTANEFEKDGFKKLSSFYTEFQKNLSENLSTKKRQRAKVKDPLYKDEIAWLYNERGIIALAQGELFDANALFKQAQLIMQHQETGPTKDYALHASIRRIQLNMAIVQIKRGNLAKAENLLSNLIIFAGEGRTISSHVSWIAEGYLALVAHMRGQQEKAVSLYEKVIKDANNRGTSRLAAIMHGHYGNLLAEMKDFITARKELELAISSASTSEQQDIYWQSRISLVKLNLEEGKITTNSLQQDILSIKRAEQYAQQMGIYRLEVRAKTVLAELMLKEGDVTLAGKHATLAAAMAARHGMRVYKLDALCVYGKALINRGQFKLARDTLLQTKLEAEQKGYLNLVGVLTMLLEEI